MSYRFTTIITQEGKWHIARCVELGVVSQGKTIEDAQRNLKEAIELYLEDQPKSSHKQWQSQKAAFISTLDVEYA